MNTLIQKRYNHSESCITVEKYPRTQKVDIYFANEDSGLTIFSTDLGHIFGSIVGLEFWVLFKRKRRNKPELSYDIVRTYSLNIYTEQVE